MTAAEIAFDIIRTGKPQPCKFPVRSKQADQVVSFMGRPAGHELFITEDQYIAISEQTGSNIIAVGEGDDRFAGFVRVIFSQIKQQNFYLLTFCGYVPEKEEPKPVYRGNPDEFAARLILSAIEKGYAVAEKNGRDEYNSTWLSAAQANALRAMLPQDAIEVRGFSFITQAAGKFCYWGMVITAKGAQKLCWMGQPDAPVKTTEKPVQPIKQTMTSVIPMDKDIPF